MNSKALDTIAVLKLYELRSETRMRQARCWFFTRFDPHSAVDILRLIQSGEAASASYRMVTSHWNLAASFVLNDGIDEKLFLESNTEHLVVFAKLQPFLPEIRNILGEPDYLLNLERLVERIPDIDRKLENRKRLLRAWLTPDELIQA